MASTKQSRNKRTETQKRRMAEQPARTEKNKLRKRKKHMKKYPNDQQTGKLV